MSLGSSETDYDISSVHPADNIAAFEETAEFVRELVEDEEDGRNIINLATDLPSTEGARLTVARTAGGEIAGCIVTTLATYGAPAWVSSLAVRRSARGKRLGYALVRQAMADRRSSDRLALPILGYVRVWKGEVNHGSLRALERNGFKALTTVPMSVDRLGSRARHWQDEKSIELALVGWMPGDGAMV